MHVHQEVCPNWKGRKADAEYSANDQVSLATMAQVLSIVLIQQASQQRRLQKNLLLRRLGKGKLNPSQKSLLRGPCLHSFKFMIRFATCSKKLRQATSLAESSFMNVSPDLVKFLRN